MPIYRVNKIEYPLDPPKEPILVWTKFLKFDNYEKCKEKFPDCSCKQVEISKIVECLNDYENWEIQINYKEEK